MKGVILTLRKTGMVMLVLLGFGTLLTVPLHSQSVTITQLSSTPKVGVTPPLEPFGLTGRNKQHNYVQRYRRQVPEQYARSGADIMDRVSDGWIVFDRESNVAAHVGEGRKLFWKIDVGTIVREKRFEVQDLRYDKGVLYFNAACLSYAKRQKGRCSTLYAYDTQQKKLLWHSRYRTSNDIFLVTDRLVIAGYGFTHEPDYLYLLRKRDGKMLKKIKLDSAHDYLEMVGDKLHVITYNRHVVFRLRGY